MSIPSDKGGEGVKVFTTGGFPASTSGLCKQFPLESHGLGSTEMSQRRSDKGTVGLKARPW